jgi:hypothetical protein
MDLLNHQQPPMGPSSLFRTIQKVNKSISFTLARAAANSIACNHHSRCISLNTSLLPSWLLSQALPLASLLLPGTT